MLDTHTRSAGTARARTNHPILFCTAAFTQPKKLRDSLIAFRKHSTALHTRHIYTSTTTSTHNIVHTLIHSIAASFFVCCVVVCEGGGVAAASPLSVCVRAGGANPTPSPLLPFKTPALFGYLPFFQPPQDLASYTVKIVVTNRIHPRLFRRCSSGKKKAARCFDAVCGKGRGGSRPHKTPSAH